MIRHLSGLTTLIFLLGPPLLGSQKSGNSSVVTKMTRVFGVTGTYTTDTCCPGRNHYETWSLLCVGWERPFDGMTEIPAGFPFQTDVVMTQGGLLCA